jgi:predicted dehydrogenase
MRRSAPLCREAAEIIRSGGIGPVTFVRAFHVQNEWPKGIGNPANEAPPEGFDWDAWLGPAPKVPYNKNRTFYRFRWFYDYSGGQLTNFGVHYLDMIHWALGQAAPLAVVAMGGKFAVTDNREIPDTMEVVWHYPGNTLVTFTQINASSAAPTGHPGAIEFRGTKGTLYVHGDGYEIVPELLTQDEFPARSPLARTTDRLYGRKRKTAIGPKKATGKDATALHARNFLDCVRSRQPCACDIETGHRSTSATLLGNIAHKMKAYLAWDAKRERFVGNDRANQFLSYAYRPPYELP